MKCRFILGLLAITAMAALNKDAFGEPLGQSFANGADAKGSAHVSPIGTGERGFARGNRFQDCFISPILLEIARETVTQPLFSGAAAGRGAEFTGEKTS